MALADNEGGLPVGGNMLGGEFDFAAVPEPSTALLVGMGSAGLGATRAAA